MTDTPARDDLFTHIHKALRRALFDLTVHAGATDWGDQQEVDELGHQWERLLDLLRAHTEHEDRYILRLLDRTDARCTEAIEDQHRDLDDLLDDLATRFEAITRRPDPGPGLDLYRDLARFTASYLCHLHEEETTVMPRIWASCSNEEIAACRHAFMAETTPAQLSTTIEYMLPALDAVTRRQLVLGIAVSAPAPVIETVLAIAERVLDADAHRSLVEAVGAPVG